MKIKSVILIGALLLNGCNYYITRFWNGYYSLQSYVSDYDKKMSAETQEFYDNEPIEKNIEKKIVKDVIN